MESLAATRSLSEPPGPRPGGLTQDSEQSRGIPGHDENFTGARLSHDDHWHGQNQHAVRVGGIMILFRVGPGKSLALNHDRTLNLNFKLKVRRLHRTIT